VTIRQKLTCPEGFDLQKVVSRNTADQVNFGATNKLAVSLDGKNVLVEQATSGTARDADLILDLAADARFRNLKSFWVHLTMTNASGMKTGTSNRVTSLRVEGAGTTVVK